jgi:hypothetical protein
MADWHRRYLDMLARARSRIHIGHDPARVIHDMFLSTIGKQERVVYDCLREHPDSTIAGITEHLNAQGYPIARRSVGMALWLMCSYELVTRRPVEGARRGEPKYRYSVREK